MSSKEEICIARGLLTYLGDLAPQFIEAMDEYAKQEAIEFYIWNAKQIGQYIDDTKMYAGLSEKDKIKITNFEKATIPSRYNLYLQSKTDETQPQ